MSIARPSRPNLIPGHFLARGMIGAWPVFDGYGLKVLEATKGVSGVDGTLGNSLSSNPTWTGGNVGWALTFTGNNAGGAGNYVDLSYNSKLSSAGAVSACAFVRCGTQTGSGANIGIFDQWNTTSNLRAWFMGIDSATGTKPEFSLSNDGTFGAGHVKDYISSITINDNLYHMISFSFNGPNGLHIFIDGKEDLAPTKSADDAITTVFTSTNRLLIGCIDAGGTPARFYTGDLHTCFLWNRFLSANEQAALFQDPYQMFSVKDFRLKSAAVVTGQKFRRTASRIGTRIGSRQTWAA